MGGFLLQGFQSITLEIGRWQLNPLHLLFLASGGLQILVLGLLTLGVGWIVASMLRGLTSTNRILAELTVNVVRAPRRGTPPRAGE